MKVNPRSIVDDAEGPWLPLTPELRAELAQRLASIELTPETQRAAMLRRPVVARQVRTGIIGWLDEKSVGGGTDWNQQTMWRYRAILREVGAPDGGRRREAGVVELAVVGGLAVVGSAAAAAAAGGPTAALVAQALLDITYIMGAVGGGGRRSPQAPGHQARLRARGRSAGS